MLKVTEKSRRKSLFKRWIDFLLFTKNNSKNNEILSRYFFEYFAGSPDLFYQFLLFFKDFLKKSKGESRNQLAHKYLGILSHLCERFGIFEEKRNLDDLCFQITEPEKYDELDQILGGYKKKSDVLIQNITTIFRELLDREKHDCHIEGRYKNIYSIYRKTLKRSYKTVLALNDIFAFRIILKNNSVDECFEVMNILHDHFYPIPDFFKDYITVPKINGYQSLHTGLNKILPDLDLPVEIQIRTQAMHDFAEHGVAAHWMYSSDKKSRIVSEKEKKLLSYFSSLSQTQMHRPQSIFCFSYLGDIFQIPAGASLIDFAYQIHSDLGHKLDYALVNGKKKPVNYVIQEGDRIELTKSPSLQVCPQWLSYTKTKEASKKISDYLKKYETI